MSGEGLIHISFAQSISPGLIHQQQVRCGLKVSGTEIWQPGATETPQQKSPSLHLGAQSPVFKRNNKRIAKSKHKVNEILLLDRMLLMVSACSCSMLSTGRVWLSLKCL